MSSNKKSGSGKKSGGKGRDGEGSKKKAAKPAKEEVAAREAVAAPPAAAPVAAAAPAAGGAGGFAKAKIAIEACCEKSAKLDERNAAAKKVADAVSEDPEALEPVLSELKTLFETSGKTAAGGRQAACLIFKALISTNQKAFFSFIPQFKLALDCIGDKTKHVAQAGEELVKAFLDKMNPNCLKPVLEQLFIVCSSAKAEQKRLTLIKELSEKHQRQMGQCMKDCIPEVAREAHNIDSGVCKAAMDALKSLCARCKNPDVVPLVPTLLQALEKPDMVKDCVHKLASTTFVEIVDLPTLAIINPILISGFRSKDTAVSRGAARIVENLATLVEDPGDLDPFMPTLLPLMEGAAKDISHPEARKVCQQACDVLKSKYSQPPLATMVKYSEVSAAFGEVLKSQNITETEDNKKFITYAAEILTMVNQCATADEPTGEEALSQNMTPILSCFADKKTTNALCADIMEKALRRVAAEEAEEEKEDAELLCDCDFSLAFGNNVLLRKTKLTLHRGKRYGLIGKNDCGKTSMMKAIADHRVEGFPSEDEMKCIYVETDIPVDFADMKVLDYMQANEDIKKAGIKREQIAEELSKVGFVKGAPASLEHTVGTLSGGWRMKLALTRAMLLKADILLMDEPTNHLDKFNKTWVEDYLANLDGVTCMFVSHDSAFLDKLATNMIHIDKHRLHYYKGNLSAFVVKVPSAKAFFELKSEKIKFKFPNPGALQGITSKGKAVVKMENISFTYPGAAKPQLNHVTIQVSLGSRVACVGVNGAGKSTMIKLLTGELLPDEGSGKVWSHPNVRIGYIAQHAFYYIEQHPDKTANEYIRWRYMNGNDREETKKIANVVTAEEEKEMKKPIELSVKNPETGLAQKIKIQIDRLTEGRRTNKAEKDQEYQVQLVNSQTTMWVLRKILEKHGWEKVLKEVDQRIATREAMFATPLTTQNVQKHCEEVGLEPEFSTHVPLNSLSGGQKVKAVLAASLWNRPHILILDEPTNYLDRESLGALAQAIREFEGGVVMITHNSQFCDNLCPTVWHLENNTLNVKGDAEWMKEMLKMQVAENENEKLGETTDKFGNKVVIKKSLASLTEKERKARRKKLQKVNKQRKKDGLDEIFSDDEDFM
eukprot:g38074.t1